jgi:LmbE family N-acetylglucosaminyl deacetylase
VPDPPATSRGDNPDDRYRELDDSWERVLALVAHPDDLEYGSASAVAKWTDSGARVTYVLATRGEAGLALPPAEVAVIREEEQRRSAAAVGVDVVEFLDHPDGVIEYGLPLRRDFARAIRRERPQAVLTINRRDSWGGESFNMADHRHVGLAVLDAVRDAANPWIFPELAEEGLQAWEGVEVVLFNGSPQATHAVDVTGYLERGIESLRCHERYLEHVGTDPDAMLRSAAEAAGRRFGCEHAVAFEVVRP